MVFLLFSSYRGRQARARVLAGGAMGTFGLAYSQTALADDSGTAPRFGLGGAPFLTVLVG